jgi:tRNA U34 2-thiouridine synthase MnmA/TrmU
LPSSITALALFSGGLDSILACRVVAAQGIRVVAVQFVTPFFEYDLLAAPALYQEKIFQKYGIEVQVVDLSPGYLELLRHPRHGFGKHFNPCIDCKILMLSRAREMMTNLDASFLVTGEVLGQRPMSQRRNSLRVIERDSGSDRLLLRPLSAKLLPETEAEFRGWVDRDKLLDFNGRSRSRQIALAREFGIIDFPNASGGCILADPNLSPRIARIYEGNFVVKPGEMTVMDVRLLLVGRQFKLPDGGWLILGRNNEENTLLQTMVQAEDAVLSMPVRPGPTAILRRAAICYDNPDGLRKDLCLAASLVVRFGRKMSDDTTKAEVCVTLGKQTEVLAALPLADHLFQGWLLHECHGAVPSSQGV